jgi:hypothetical protein
MPSVRHHLHLLLESSGMWKTEPLNVSSAMSESTPVMMRSSSHKKRMPFAQNILGSKAAYAEIVESFGDTNITLSLVEELSGPV